MIAAYIKRDQQIGTERFGRTQDRFAVYGFANDSQYSAVGCYRLFLWIARRVIRDNRLVSCILQYQ